MVDLVDWASARVARRALFAFNTNVDAVRTIDARGIDFRGLPGELSCLEECMVKGVEREVAVSESSLDFLRSRVGFDSLQVGGQAGISASAACRLGVESFLHVADKGKTQLSVLDDKLLLAGENGFASARRLAPLGESATHFILEYSKGALVRGKTVPVSNRFIASFDSGAFELRVDDVFLKHASACIGEIDKAIIGGFHLLSPKFFKRVDEVAKIVSGWKKANSRLRVHLELGDFQDLSVLKRVLEVFAPLCDCLGLNELELKQCLKALDGMPRNEFSDARLLLNKVRTIVVHSSDYSFALSKDKREVDLKNALFFASLLACFKAANARFASFSDLRTFSPGEPCERSAEKEQDFDKQKLDCMKAFTPSFTLGNPRQTVGLGDVFATGFFLTL
ncbi:hypothetical protein HY992_04795 [Candidatus Micrarchaeota archaeon]|nr:hypothetical protein [Candidatus Micrarchaeota archaeon]